MRALLLNGETDRFRRFECISLEKADKVIFTRGKMPWSNSIPEGEGVKEVSNRFRHFPRKYYLPL